MNGWHRHLALVLGAAALALLAGCPLPFEYNGKGAGNAPSSDPSSPNMTAPVTVSYSAQGGGSGTIADGGSAVTGQTTTVTLSTTSLNAVIFYTTDGTTLTNLRTAQKIDASSGTFTITRATTTQVLDIHAIAVGPNMLPSPPVHATVSVSPYPILTVTRSSATISEDAGTATFTITASSAPAGDLAVSLVTGGTYASAEVTGLQPSGTTFTATLKASTTTVTLPITANHDINVVNETVSLAINPDPAPQTTYTVGSPAGASILIQDDMAPTYTVTYDGNGNTGGSVPTDGNSYLAGALVTVAGQGSLVRSGYTFAGWNTAPDGTGTAHGPGTSMTMGSANVVLYAMWTLIPTYSVTYNGNGSDGGTVPTDGTAYHTGDTATVQSPGTLSQSGSVFAGWNTASDASGATYFGGNTFTIAAANVVLYATWLQVSGTTITSVPLNATNVVIPEGITGITQGAFQGHPKLVSVTLPSTLTSIPVQAFLGCPQLTTLVSSGGRYQVINGALVDTQTWNLMLVPAKLSGAFAIPSPVVSIDPYAFDLCTNITDIAIPPTMTTISGNGFSGLRSAIPVVLPPTVTSIGAFAFYNSFVTTIVVPPSVTDIGTDAMGLCPNLSNIYMQGPPPTLGGQVFAAPLPLVHVPDLATELLYLASPTWLTQGVTITFP